MKGTLLWNLWAAVFGFLLVFSISAQVTAFDTAIYRGTMGFFSFFVLSYVFRALWSFVTAPSDTAKDNHTFDQSVTTAEMDADDI